MSKLTALTLQQFYEKLNTSIMHAGGLSAFAARHGLPVRLVSDTQSARSNPGPRILSAMGYVRLLVWPVINEPGHYLRQKQVYEKLNTAVRECGSQVEFARNCCIAPSTLSNIMNGARGFTPVLSALGLGVSVARYIPAKEIRWEANHG
ncbi:helix-turn-helix domain-containing protein [Acetobacter oryzifermentans]|uniref:Transcriptional regulator n=1 Tax=Acetobacter oryzifermentans TaxID=1633874 RepID=A0ABN4NMH1_9PROT|nr:transcriptional regulator [Acetobacter oryzifermentans]ANA13094.1 hypothetical protein WG31_02965 [Acetobacter oryzifermentans]